MSRTELRTATLWVMGALALHCTSVALADEPAAGPAGPRQGDWLIRGSVMKVWALTQATDIGVIGGRIEAPDKTLPGLDISYFASDHWVVEFQGGVFERAYHVKDSVLGSFPVGKVETAALSFALQYHFRPAGSLRPYVGAGFNHAWERAVRPAENIPPFDVKPVTSALVTAGVDVHLSDHWLLNASARYFLSPAYEFHGEGFSATVRIDTLVLGTGIGLYF